MLPSEILDRLPPHNLNAEKGVLGSVLLDPQVLDDIATLLKPVDFYAESNQKLYEHLLAMHNESKRVDTTLLLERLRTAGDLELVGGSAYLAEVVHAVPHAANAVYYAEIVRDKAILRALIHASTEILRDAYEPSSVPADSVTAAESAIFAVREERTSEQITPADSLMIAAFDRIDQIVSGKVSKGFSTGWADLDKLTGGFHDSELTILASRPSMGKTAVACNLADHLAVEAGCPVLFVSLEMAELEVAFRLLSARAKVDGNKLRNGFLSTQDRERLVQASAELGRSPLWVDDTASRSVPEIAAAARRMKRRRGLDLLIIDYLQLVRPENLRDNRQEQVAQMTRRLKGLARELKIPVLCVAQLNRQVDAGKEGHRPQLSHLRESGAIEQDADVVMFIHREEYYCESEEAARTKGVDGKAELIVRKQRNGPTGDIPLTWFKQFTRFEPRSIRPYEESPERFSEFDAFTT